MELTDDNVILRPPVEADAEALVSGVRLSHNELYPWLPWAKADYGMADALPWINLTFDPHPFVITDLAGSLIGGVGLNAVDEENRRANLGYWLRTDATGKGYATSATKLMAGYGMETLGLQRIEIVMSIKNEPSRAVARRSGAAYEGVLRNRLRLHGTLHDAHSYSLIPE